MRDDDDLDDCASASDTSPHYPDSSVPEAMDVDEVEDTPRGNAQSPNEDVIMKITEYPLYIGDNVDANDGRSDSINHARVPIE